MPPGSAASAECSASTRLDGRTPEAEKPFADVPSQRPAPLADAALPRQIPPASPRIRHAGLERALPHGDATVLSSYSGPEVRGLNPVMPAGRAPRPPDRRRHPSRWRERVVIGLTFPPLPSRERNGPSLAWECEGARAGQSARWAHPPHPPRLRTVPSPLPLSRSHSLPLSRHAKSPLCRDQGARTQS